MKKSLLYLLQFYEQQYDSIVANEVFTEHAGADPGISGGEMTWTRKNRQGSGGRRRPPAGSSGRAPSGG
jgi:hypothetical protein